MNDKKTSVRTLTMLALLVAMSIVFSRVLSISTGFVRFNLGSLPVLLAAVVFGPGAGFAVGAALLCQDGTIYTGCNIESSAYTPTVCAERTAFFKAVSEGKREFVCIAVAGGRKDADLLPITTPCGVCRQVMMEFCDPRSFLVSAPHRPSSIRRTP